MNTFQIAEKKINGKKNSICTALNHRLRKIVESGCVRVM